MAKDIETMDERTAYELYLKLKQRFEVKVDCKIFTNCNYVGDCLRNKNSNRKRN